MIFVTLGNAPLDFSRLAREIDRITPILNEEIFIQLGHTEYPVQFAMSEKFLDSEKMQEFIAEASIVISHGGWGTISECLEKGKKLIAVPRKLGVEHNHPQEELVHALAQRGCLLAVDDIATLGDVIEEARSFTPRSLVRGNASLLINNFLNTTCETTS
jgi:UDP-N-acetylglucosamine transferase subunit ALG13